MAVYEDVGIYVDGQSFLHGVANQFDVSQDKLSRFDMGKFLEFAAGTHELRIVRRVVFDSRVTKDASTCGYVVPYRPAVEAMHRAHGFEINRDGEIVYSHNARQFFEKGVDVAMGLTILEDVAVKRQVRTAVLITADRDIKPVVRKIAAYGGESIQINIEGFNSSYLGVDDGNYWYVRQVDLAQCMPA